MRAFDASLRDVIDLGYARLAGPNLRAWTSGTASIGEACPESRTDTIIVWRSRHAAGGNIEKGNPAVIGRSDDTGWEADDLQANGLTTFRLRQFHEEHMMMPTLTVIEVAAKEVAAELQRQGIDPDERVTLTIEPELIPGRRESRKLVIAAGLTDDDIDNLIKRAQHEVEPLLPG